MKITSYGHSCYAVESNGSRILFDPFITENPLASKISLEAIQADYLLITHGHFDHIADAEKLLQQTKAHLISNVEIVNWFQKKGFENATAMNIGGTISLKNGDTVSMTSALHSSSLPDGTYGGNPVGFIVSGEKSFYFSGDTALSAEMKILAQQNNIDFGILCLGDVFTMGMKDALTCASWFGFKKVIGCHYDSFPPIQIDKVKAKNLFNKQNIELFLPAPGETIEF